MLYVPAHAKAYDLQTWSIPNSRFRKQVKLAHSLKTLNFRGFLVGAVLTTAAVGCAVSLGLNDLIRSQINSFQLAQTGTQTFQDQKLAGTSINRFIGRSQGKQAPIVKNTDRMRQTFEQGTQQKSAIVFTPATHTTFSSRTPRQFALNQLAPVAVNQPAARATYPETSSVALEQPKIPSPAENVDLGPTGTITASVNMRETGSSRGKILEVLQQGTEVSYGDCSKYWCKVEVGGKTGFVSQKYVKR
ncbi:MAG: SH3 domain-containing protein [Roseibium sp.]